MANIIQKFISMIVYMAKPSSLERTTTINLIYKMNELSSSEHIRELKIDSTLWATPTKIINLLDFKPEKLSIDMKINSNNNNTPDPSSKDLRKIHQVRYENGGFYLTIDNIKGYFNLDDNVGGILDMILTNDQKNKYHQVWKEVFKNVNGGDGELKLHEKIRLFDNSLPIEKIFKIP